MADFSYGWTCPKIDKEIQEIQDKLENFIQSKNLEKKITVKELYEECIEKHIENLRTLNEDMRDSAEHQLDELEKDKNEEIDCCKDDIRILEDDKLKLEKIIEELKDE